MKVTVYLSKGKLAIEDFEAQSVLDLKEELSTGEFLTFEMDDATVLVNPAHVVRIDVDD